MCCWYLVKKKHIKEERDFFTSEPSSIVLKIVDLLYGVMAPNSAIASQNFYYKVPAYDCKLSIKNSPYYQLKIS